MHCLTLRIETASALSDKSGVQRNFAQRLPSLRGLRARSWRARPFALEGQYLFDDEPSLRRFHAALTDHEPAAAGLLNGASVTARTDPLPEDVATTVFDRPVFIVSAPRAGSTLLYELLAKCDALWSIDGEMQHIIDAIPALNLYRRGCRSQALDETDADGETARIVRCCLLAAIQSHSGRKLLERARCNWPARIRLLEKTPENALRVPFLHQVFPDARFIYLSRDLRQNVASIIEAWKHPGFIAIPHLPGWPDAQWRFLLPDGWRSYRGSSLCHIAAFQWAAANKAIIDALEAIPTEQWTTVSYANLIADPAAEIERLCGFIEVEMGARLRASLQRALPLSATTITPPSPIKWKHNPDFDPAVTKPLQPLAGRIRSLGVDTADTVRRAHHTTSVRFACHVDQLAPAVLADDVIVAPSLRVAIAGGAPLGLLGKLRHRERFQADHPMLWIEDPATEVWMPLWLHHKQAWLCHMLQPGRAAPAALTGRLRGQLGAAGVLTTAEAIHERHAYGSELCQAGRRNLSELRYCGLPNLLDPVLCAALARYYNTMIEKDEWPLGDAQVERRHGWHNERIAQFLHYQLVDFVSRVAGKKLKPTYAFSSAYRGGARLDAHMDREQCDYTLSLLIDESPPVDGAPWPLWFETPAGKHNIVLRVGDGVLFRGCELPHWRGSASAEHEQINLLFHFVPTQWAGVID